jgi:hypothetical protein
MTLFVATHKWKKENFKTVTKKVIEALQQAPEGATNCLSYVTTEFDGAWCVWEAESAKLVKDFLTKMVPEMNTEVTPVLHFFPPNPDLYAMLHTLAS